MKRILLSTLFIIMAAVCLQAQIKVGSLYYDNFTSSTAVVTSAPEDEKYAGDITIPRSITPDQRHKFDVVGIGDFAFSCCSDLTSVIIPSSVITIGNSAFYQCTKLKTVTFSTSSKLKTIAQGVFAECEVLSSIELPSTIESIEKFSFYNCKKLKTVVCHATTVPNATDVFLEDEVKDATLLVPKDALSTYKESTEWKKFGTIAAIEDGIPVLYYGINYALDKATKTAKVISNPEKKGLVDINGYVSYDDIQFTVTSIVDDAFINNTDITAVNIPQSVTSIGNNAFYGCTGLTEIVIPNSVTKLGDGAFRGCTNLVKVDLPESLTEMDGFCFYKSGYGGGKSFQSVICRTTSLIDFNNCFEKRSIQSATLYVTESAYEDFKNASGWSDFGSIKLIESLTPVSIAQDNNRFSYYLDKLTMTAEVAPASWRQYPESITIPSTVTHEGLTYTVTGISPDAFANHEELNNITMPNTITTIGMNAFAGSGIESITLSESLEAISNSAFANCHYLTSIVLPESVKTIESSAFENCYALQSVEMLGVAKIGRDAFINCSSLEKVVCHSVWVDNILGSEGAFFYSNDVSDATLYVPSSAINYYQNEANWSVFGNIVAIEAEGKEKCADPVISYKCGEILAKSDTPESICTLSVKYKTTTFEYTNNGGVIPTVILTATAYATADGYSQSNTVEEDIVLCGGDLNADGSINVSDVTSLINKILGK